MLSNSQIKHIDEVVSYITQSGYLMYMTDPREEGERFINVVFLEKNNATFKIKDFTDPSCNWHTRF